MSNYKFYWKLLVRRLPIMMALFLLATAVGVVVAVRLPKVYQTQATLLVESAQIPGNMVQSTIEIDPSEQLEIIQRRLMTRKHLIDVANKHKIFPNAADMTPDEIVREMRSRTNVTRASGRNKATLMTISFEGKDPQKVAEVVNQYVTIVLTTNSDFRSGRAAGTLDFFEQEVNALSETIDQQNTKIVAFKADNADALPDNLNYRLNRQTLLQERLSRSERDLEALQSQRTSIQRVYEATGSTGTKPVSPEEQQLRKLEGELRMSLSIYSEQNPKVRVLRTQIKALQEQMAAAAPGVEGEEKDPQATALDISLAELDSRTVALERDIADATDELAKLEDAISRTPANGIILESMERDLQNTQNLYSSAVQRLSQARMGERIELSSKGEKITVLEAANVPDVPFKPNRKAVAMMGAGVGLGLAGGLFVLLELLNQSIRRPSDIVSALDITPLATIPHIESDVKRRLRRMTQAAVLLIIIVGVLISLWAVDTYYLPLDLIFEKFKDRVLN